MPTVVAGGVTSFVIAVIGGAYVVGGIAVAGAGIAEAGATDDAGILVTPQGDDLVGLGVLMIGGGALIANATVGNAIRCGVQ